MLRTNLDAAIYVQLTKWQGNAFPPTILQEVRSERIQGPVISGSKQELQFSRFPCHAQGIERSAKTVPKALRRVWDDI